MQMPLKFRLCLLFSVILLNLSAQVWSPNGEKIAFFYIHSIEDIYLVNPDGTNFEVMDKHPERDFAPQWSPNGKRLLFTSVRDSHHELYQLKIKNQKLKKITNTNFDSEDGDYSPDGKSIVFSSNRQGNSDLFVINKKGKKVRQLTKTNRIETTPRWSPSGQKILFRAAKNADAPTDLFLMDINGNKVQQITNTPEGEFHQSWSPDGLNVCFIKVKDGIFELHIMPATGGESKILVQKKGFQAFYPAWSPDGQYITFTRDVMEGTKSGLPALFSVDMKGNERLISDKNSFE